MKCRSSISVSVVNPQRSWGNKPRPLDRPVLEAIVDKLPVLFVSCDARSLEAQRQAGSGPARMIWGQSVRSVLLLSTDTSLQAPLVTHLKGDHERSERVFSLLSARGFAPAIQNETSEGRENFLRALLSEEPADLSELRLNTGMSEGEYRLVGQCLETIREQGVLVICLDDKRESRVALHDRHLREMISGWVQDQQWGAAISFKGGQSGNRHHRKLEDPTVCLLNAAFTLGGCKFPQRMFSSGMNNAGQMLSGFGWMR